MLPVDFDRVYGRWYLGLLDIVAKTWIKAVQKPRLQHGKHRQTLELEPCAVRRLWDMGAVGIHWRQIGSGLVVSAKLRPRRVYGSVMHICNKPYVLTSISTSPLSSKLLSRNFFRRTGEHSIPNCSFLRASLSNWYGEWLLQTNSLANSGSILLSLYPVSFTKARPT